MANGYIDLPVFGSTGGGGGGGTGTVTSVDLVMPSDVFDVSGNPISTAGTFTVTFDTQANNTFFASTGSTPYFRTITSSDVPAANLASTGNGGVTGTLPGANQAAANLASSGNGGVTGTLPSPNITPINLASNSNGGVTGVLAVANGGTASSTGVLAGAAVLGNGTSPFQSVTPGSSGTFLGSDGTSWAARTIPVQSFTQVAANLATTGNGGVTGTLPVVNGGTSLSTLPAAAVIIGNGTSAPTSVSPGTSGNVLISNGTVWQSSTVPVQVFTQVAANLASSGNGGVTGTLPVVNGGTSLSTLTANNVILGNGTAAPLFVAPSTNGNVLTSNGTTWVSQAPAAVSAQTASYEITNLGIVATTAANDLTVSIVTSDGQTPSTGNPIYIGTRNFNSTTGLYNRRSITSSLTFTTLAGNGYGMASTAIYDLYVYALDNNGTINLGMSLANFDEGIPQNVYTFGSTANVNRLLYSTSSYTQIPIRNIGKLEYSMVPSNGAWTKLPLSISLNPYKKKPVVMRAFLAAAPQSIPNNSFTIVMMDTKEIDTRNSYSIATGLYTVSEAGYYECTGSFRFSTNGTGERLYGLEINSDGITYEVGWAAAVSGGPTRLDGSIIKLLYPGDTLAFKAYQNSGGNLDLDNSTNGEFSYIEVKKIGDPK